ncbi:MAG TPA: NYN domain-containing protein, partial [Candidatus Paceibacterota bacterium]
MSQPLYFDGKKFISSKRASEVGGYTQDYIGQLIRGKKIEARMVGRSWFVSEESLKTYQRILHPEISVRPEVLEEKLLENFSAISPPEIAKTKTPEISPYTPLEYRNDDRELIPNIKKLKNTFFPSPPRQKFSFQKIFVNSHRLAELGNKSLAILLSASLVAGGYFLSDAKNAKAVFEFINSTTENIGLATGETFDDLVKSVRNIARQYEKTLLTSGEYSRLGFILVHRGGEKITDVYSAVLNRSGSFVYMAISDPMGTLENTKKAYMASIYEGGDLLSDSRDFLAGFDLAQFTHNLAYQSVAAVSNASNPLGRVFENVALGIYRGVNQTFKQTGIFVANLFDGKNANIKDQKDLASNDGIILVPPAPKISTTTPSRIRVATNSATSSPTISSDSSKNSQNNLSNSSPVVVTTNYYVPANAVTRSELSDIRSELLATINTVARTAGRNTTNVERVYDNINLGNFKGSDIGKATITDSTFSGTTVSATQLTVTGGDSANLLTSTFGGNSNFGSGTLLVNSPNRNVGVATSSPFTTFSVGGNAYIGGNLTATGTLSFANLTGSASSTLQNFTFVNATGTSATTTNIFSTTASSTNLFSSLLNIGGNALTVTSARNVGIGTTSPTANLEFLQNVNGATIISAYRITDTAPSGDFISYMNRAGTQLFRVDNSGNLLAGGIINSGSQTITSMSAPQFRVQYDSSNEITQSITSTGSTTIAVNGSTPALIFTPQTNRVTSFQFTNAASVPILSIDTSNQRVGIGTTTPGQKLSVAGDILGNNLIGSYFTATTSTSSIFPNFTSSFSTTTNATTTNLFSTTASSTNLFSSLLTVAGNGLVVDSSRNVGIGTTSPWGLLSVNPNGISGPAFVVGSSTQCVTGDTKLRRRRKKKKEADEDGEYEYDEPTILDIEAGDEIQSLDQKTGTLVWSKVKQVCATGKKDIYKLTTASGKTIRTTREHPYLVSSSRVSSRIAMFIDGANIAASLQHMNARMDYKSLIESFGGRDRVVFAGYYHPDFCHEGQGKFFARLKHLGYKIIAKTLKVIKQQSAPDAHKANFDVEIATDASFLADTYDTAVLLSGDSDFTYLSKQLQKRGKKVVVIGAYRATATELRNQCDLYLNIVTLPCVSFIDSASNKNNEGSMDNRKDPRRGHHNRLSPALSILSQVTMFVKDGVWTKAGQVTEGDMISTVGANTKPIYERVAKVERLPAEDVYDIEIEDTHNFVANNIIAHNTAFLVHNSGNVGIGTTTPSNLLDMYSSTAAIASFSGGATKGEWSMGYDVTNNRFAIASSTSITSNVRMVIDNQGNVGIGTTTP